MHITTHNRRVNSSNAFGYIKGSVEPGKNICDGEKHAKHWCDHHRFGFFQVTN